MRILLITSLGEGEGKTAICVGLGKIWQGEGKKVGYLKPQSDGDALFVKKALGLTEDVQVLCPEISELQNSLGSLSDKDIVLVEAISPQLLQKLEGAKVLLIAFYPRYKLDEVIAKAQGIGERLIGIIINAVPSNRMEKNPWLIPLKDKGILLLGVLPQDRTLFAPSIADLCQYLKGKMLYGEEASQGLVENIMVGVYTPDPSPLYFQIKGKKAVIIRGGRPDMQLGALETPTQCLILTGGGQPHPYVRQQAELKGVPIIVVEEDTPSVLKQLEEVLTKTRFHQEEKIGKIEALLKKHLDWQSLKI